MTSYTNYSDLLRQYNFTNLPDNDPLDDLEYPLQQDANGNYIITYQMPVNQTTLLSTGYYSSTDAEYINFHSVNNTQQTIINSILNPVGEYSVSFSDIANITFATSAIFDADIIFMQNDGSSPYLPSNAVAYAHDYADPVGQIYSEKKYGDIIFNKDSSDGWSSVDLGSPEYNTILHEIGHSLGLSHPDDGGLLDNQQYSIMSYNYLPSMDAGGYPYPFNTPTFPSGLQLYDILALQDIYDGRNYSTRGVDDIVTLDINEADTTYKIGKGFGVDASTSFIYTIWDGAGNDTIDATGYTENAIIDLRQGGFSSIGEGNDIILNAENNVAIAYYTVIENAIGTNLNDTLIGNAWDKPP